MSLFLKCLATQKRILRALPYAGSCFALTWSKISVLYEGNIIIIRQGIFTHSPLPQRLIQSFSDFLKKYGIVCSISTTFNQITELGRHYVQACSAIRYLLQGKGPAYTITKMPPFFLFRSSTKNIGYGLLSPRHYGPQKAMIRKTGQIIHT